MNNLAVFYYRSNELEGRLTTHVDNLFTTGSEKFEEEIRQPLLKRFNFGAINIGDELKVLGLNISHKGKDIFINQNDYISRKMEYVNIKKNDLETLTTQLSEEDKRTVWQAVGRCRWICDQTRLDICYDKRLLTERLNSLMV